MADSIDVQSRILNCEPSQNVHLDWRFEHARDAGIIDAAAPVPAAKDLREA
jgi:hypothetical protein